MTVSEFDYPRYVQELLGELKNELVDPCRVQLRAVRHEYQQAIAQAHASLEETKKHVEALTEKEMAAYHATCTSIDNTLEGARARVRRLQAVQDGRSQQFASEARQVKASLGELLNHAREHLKREGIAVPAGDLVGNVEAPPTTADPSAELDRIRQTVAQHAPSWVAAITKSRPLPFWPRDEAGRAAIALTTTTLFFLLGREWLVLLWWPVFVAASRIIRRWKLEGDYQQVAKVVAEATSRLEECMDRIAKEAEAASEEVEAKESPPAERDWREAVDAAQARHMRVLEEIRAAHLPAAKAAHADAVAVAEERLAAGMARIRERCHPVYARLVQKVDDCWRMCGFSAMPWESLEWSEWKPDPSPGFAARLGTITVDASDLSPVLQGAPCVFTLPALVSFMGDGCLILRAAGQWLEDANHALQSAALRALASIPPGKVRFTLIDPVGLGHNAADFLALGDADATLIGGKAWTEPHHIEQQLAGLSEHMATVIQKYLRREFDTIHAYNADANEVAEPFRFLLVFDFPAGFTDQACHRLGSIMRNGQRCGVYVLMVRDTSRPMPYGVELADLEAHATCLDLPESTTAAGRRIWGAPFALDELTPDDRQVASRVVEVSGQAALDAMNVEVPFTKMLALAGLEEASWWRASATQMLRAPLGPSGARRIQHLELGQGLTHHGLIIGRTGSGKTNLMHVIIATLALTYPPDELEMYLIDLKGGVGFKPYARHSLPHATVIAIESDREFAMSVLQGLERELKRRFELFRAAGVDNIQDYRTKAAPGEHCPRILLVVDEFQQLLIHEDAQSQLAKGLLDRVATQGRSFGLHLLLATQSLAGGASLAASTMGQLVVRIALPCGDADARIILGDDNNAARSLSRPGEGIYNAGAGEVAANIPFQAALYTEEDLTRHLEAISGLAATKGIGKVPVVFEGNEPASLAKCKGLHDVIAPGRWSAPTTAPVIWLGEPVAMGPPVAARMAPQAGRHVLVVERNEADGLGVLYAAWIALLCTHRPGTAEFHVLDFGTADAGWSGLPAVLQDSFLHRIQSTTRRTLPALLERLAGTAKAGPPEAGKPSGRTYLLVLGLQRARDLRSEDEYSFGGSGEAEVSLPDAFRTVLRDGPEAGIHVLAWCDTLPNARRVLGGGIREFGIRIAGPMAADESDALLDTTDAARLDKPHRMLVWDEDRPGAVVKILPYAVPDFEWLRNLGAAQAKWTD